MELHTARQGRAQVVSYIAARQARAQVELRAARQTRSQVELLHVQQGGHERQQRVQVGSPSRCELRYQESVIRPTCCKTGELHCCEAGPISSGGLHAGAA